MTQILLRVAEADTDDLHREQLALQLRRELLDLDVDSVESVTTEAPDGARSGVGAVAGMLVATLTPAHIGAVVVSVLSWLRRSPAERRVHIEIDGDVLDVTNADLELQTKAIETFLARHAQPVGS